MSCRKRLRWNFARPDLPQGKRRRWGGGRGEEGGEGGGGGWRGGERAAIAVHARALAKDGDMTALSHLFDLVHVDALGYRPQRPVLAPNQQSVINHLLSFGRAAVVCRVRVAAAA